MPASDELLTNAWGKPIHMVVHSVVRKHRRGQFPNFVVKLGKETFYLATDDLASPTSLGLALFPCCNSSTPTAAAGRTISRMGHRTETNDCTKAMQRIIVPLDGEKAQEFLERIAPVDALAAPLVAGECSQLLMEYAQEAWKLIYTPGTRRKVLHLGRGPHG